MTKSALQGVVWNYSGIAVLVVVQIVSTIATARLIAPAWFGVYAAAQAASGLAAYFTFATVGLAVLRRSELGEKTVGTAVVISLVAATLVLVALWFVAPTWADAWNIPAATRLIRVLAFSLFFNSLSAVPLALVRRRLRFGASALVETSTQVSGITVGVVLAVFLHTTMALAIGQTVGAGALFVGAIALARHDLRLGFDRGEGRTLLTYGGQLSGLYFSAWAINAIPSWFTSLSFGKFTLGLYNRASLVINLPLGAVVDGEIAVDEMPQLHQVGRVRPKQHPFGAQPAKGPPNLECEHAPIERGSRPSALEGDPERCEAPDTVAHPSEWAPELK